MAIRFADGRWINGVDNIAAPGFDNAKATALNALWAVRSGSAGTVKLLATGVYSGVGGEAPLAGADGSLRTGVAASWARFVDNGDGTSPTPSPGSRGSSGPTASTRTGAARSPPSTASLAASAASPTDRARASGACPTAPSC